MKKLLVVLLVLAGVTAGAFAQDVFASYNAPGDFNVYASVGYWWGIDVNVAAEYMIGEFDLGPVPFDWGVMARGGMQFWGGGLDFGVAALATLHMGLSWNLEFSVGAGVTAFNTWTTFPVTWAQVATVRYWFSENMAVFAEEGSIGFYYWGVGLEFKL